MSGWIQDLLQGAAGTFFGSDYLRDYQHAAKTFRPNSYQNAPKLKFLFHVYFDINTEAYAQNVNNGANFGLLVKTVKLPSFNFSTTELNQYNRKRIIQTKIKYEPIDITFHDDNGGSTNAPNSGGMIRRLWEAYYNYYYADNRAASVVFDDGRGSNPNTNLNGQGGQSAPTQANYNTRTQYSPSISGNVNWGYQGEPVLNGDGTKVPFFKNITVYGFNQHNWVAYTLVNPIITRFDHDTYSYADGQGTMENKMTLDYETVLYNAGALSGKDPGRNVPGFGDDATYDTNLSPIARAGSNQTILGQGGLVDGVTGVISALRPDENGNVNVLGAIQAAGTTYNTFKNANIKQIAKQEVVAGITNAVQQTPNRNQRIAIPIFGATPTNKGTAGAPSTATATPAQVGTKSYPGSQI